MKDDILVIGERFSGIPGVALGGYLCGLIAGELGSAVEATLRCPPPVGRPFTVRKDAARTLLLEGETVIAEARAAELEIDAPTPVSVDEAERGARRYPGFIRSPYPDCFCCGRERALGDGLRIFPGPIDEQHVAAVWNPYESLAADDGNVAPEFLWAALDCPTYWGIDLAHGPLPALVTGRIHARIERPLRVSERCVVMGWPISHEGRKFTGGAALFSSSGELVALARAVWFAAR